MSTSSLKPQPPDPLRFEITCSAEKPLLSILRRFVVSVAEEVGFAGDDLFKIEMAVDEACSNALIHAYPLKPPDERPNVDMKVLIEPDALTIQIQDYGRQLPPDEYKGVNSLHEYSAPDRPAYGGLGILIMKQFMDEVQFMAIPNTGTMVTLRKVRRAPHGIAQVPSPTPAIQ